MGFSAICNVFVRVVLMCLCVLVVFYCVLSFDLSCVFVWVFPMFVCVGLNCV